MVISIFHGRWKKAEDTDFVAEYLGWGSVHEHLVCVDAIDHEDAALATLSELVASIWRK
jgi:hypothetical protein